MKYAILFLFALVLPFSAAHAVKSPFSSYNGDSVKEAVKNNPFTSRHVQKDGRKTSSFKAGKDRGSYNGDEQIETITKRGHSQGKSRQKNFEARDQKSYSGN